MAVTTTKKLINNPDDLISELIEGMISAHPDLLTTEGETGRAIVARNGPREGKVGIVIGGGSGHEPAFAGYVGRGLADAAPLGNIFASPSPSQIMDAAVSADGGEGVLFLFGNYTGDVMNFSMACDRLANVGIKARNFVVTDDVASAPAEKAQERRGIAGGFFVFKVAGAAADLGLSFQAVQDAAQRANEATLTMGVALSACSMPQTGKANFSIPAGEMEVGMGIHGEPGISREPVGSADDVAEKLLSPILEELQLDEGDEVAVLVNGLGSTTQLELYLLHRRVSQCLMQKGVVIHNSWVGEYCTSLEMAGASITLMKLDEQLKTWLDHPCQTAALKVGDALPVVSGNRRDKKTLTKQPIIQGADLVELKKDGDVTPARFVSMLKGVAAAVISEKQRLCELDGVIGDGDHGVTMEIGWKAVLARLEDVQEDLPISQICYLVSDAFLEAVGASVGPLYASGFDAGAKAVRDRLNLDAGAMVKWLEAMGEGIQLRGGGREGDKTMLDAWLPAARAARTEYSESGDLQSCLVAARIAGLMGAEKTRELESKRGRSKKLGARSVGHMDPGAASAALMLDAIADSLDQ